MASTPRLLVPKVEKGGSDFSPKSVLRSSPVDVSSSSEEIENDGQKEEVAGENEGEDEDESEEEASSDSDASSNHSDRSDSEEEYEVESDDDDELEPRAKKQKKMRGERRTEKDGVTIRATKKSRVKTTPQRSDCRTRNSNPGRRKVGSRIYDSVFGKTCHWCRQKTVEVHVECWRCPIRFCGQCLRNRNGEDVSEETEKNVRWICPKCRGGCGPGCKNCCNCGPCRKLQNYEPTGQLINMVRRNGFDNAHDFLVHLKTDEDPEAIARRKEGRGWTKATGAVVDSDDEDVKPDIGTGKGATKVGRNLQTRHKQVRPSSRRGDSNREVNDDSEKQTSFNVKEERVQQGAVQPACRKSTRLQKHTARTSVSKSADDDLFSVDIKPSELSGCIQGDEFSRKLEAFLERSFSLPQLRQMQDHVSSRKAITRLRQTRSRSVEVPSSSEGFSYLDHYPDLDENLRKQTSPEEKLKLLRGFFFWLQHSCMDGAFRPWVTTNHDEDATGECVEISGPDCQVISVLLAIDDDQPRVSPVEWEDKKPVINVATREPVDNSVHQNSAINVEKTQPVNSMDQKPVINVEQGVLPPTKRDASTVFDVRKVKTEK